MGKDVIVACDFASAEATFAFLDKFAGCTRKPFLKIGMYDRRRLPQLVGSEKNKKTTMFCEIFKKFFL